MSSLYCYWTTVRILPSGDAVIGIYSQGTEGLDISEYVVIPYVERLRVAKALLENIDQEEQR